jgi:galactokinase
VIKEDERTSAAVAALGSKNFSRVGQLMVESHDSLRDDYEASPAEFTVWHTWGHA